MQITLAVAQRPATCAATLQVQARQASLPTATFSSKQQAAAQPRRRPAQLAVSTRGRRQTVVTSQAAAVPDPEKLDRFKSANKDYAVLTKQIEDTAAEVVEALQGTSLFLVGMMGSGKSTIGKLISQALGYCFFDTDSLIEQLSQKKVSEIFAEDGEAEFRELETQVLAELAPFKNCVVATGGGVPTRAENWGHMQGGISVWLNGQPTLLAHRVVADGSAKRPLIAQGEGKAAGGEGLEEYHAAVARLTALLEDRRVLYEMADLAVGLEGSGPDADIGAPAMEVTYRVLHAINERVKNDTEERKRRMDFEIVREGELPATMRVMDSPVAKAEQQDPFLP
ncbi:hypothetical protein D9Q98_000888 [Chlorella vulgaris]|uniref:Shikimate kinase n=1 Tax=Chlorella vulgaris TaxID=3077 RepID=A0A9D4Z223_CHLVU|nr:hypothetical protein D9Q98_000888 [Chlorella vulgaris]